MKSTRRFRMRYAAISAALSVAVAIGADFTIARAADGTAGGVSVVAGAGVRATAAVAAAPLIALSAARAASPLAGAHYAGHARDAVTRTVVHVSLIVDDVGGEFAGYSYFEADPTCHGRGTSGSSREDVELAGPLGPVGLAVRIRRGGRFHYRDRYAGEVRGRFVNHGRAVVGTVTLHEDSHRRCATVHARFRVGVVGFPARRPPGGLYPCDRLTVAHLKRVDNDDAYRVVDHGRGCTRARADAIRFHASAACRALTEGQTCTVGDATCQAIRGGWSGSLASARCWSTADISQDAELTHLVPCRSPAYDGGDLQTWAVNLDCGSASTFPFRKLDKDSGPCGGALSDLDFSRPGRCAPLAGFQCTIRGAGVDLEMQISARCI